MPRVTEEHRAAMRTRIHAAAMECFMRHGVAGTTMAQIIKESGLSAGAIYGYYPSKAELTRAVADTVLSDRRDQIAALAAMDPLPAPADMISTLIETFPEDIVRSSLILQFWGNAHQDPAVHQLATGVISGLREVTLDYLARWLIQSGGAPEAAAEQARLVFPAMLSMIQGYLIQSALDPGLRTADYTGSVRALLAGVLRTPPPRT